MARGLTEAMGGTLTAEDTPGGGLTMVVSLRAVAVPTGVFAASEDWAAGGGVDNALADRIERAAGELADLVTGRPAGTRPVDPFADPTPLEELLRRT